MAEKAVDTEVQKSRLSERRARQEKEEQVKLRRRADDLVRKAYFRYAGALLCLKCWILQSSSRAFKYIMYPCLRILVHAYLCIMYMGPCDRSW